MTLSFPISDMASYDTGMAGFAECLALRGEDFRLCGRIPSAMLEAAWSTRTIKPNLRVIGQIH